MKTIEHNPYYNIPKTEDPKEWIGKIALFIIYPFGAFVFSLFRNAASKSSYLIYFLFGVVFCWNMAPMGDRYDDLMGIRDRFINTNFTTKEILEQTYSFFTFAEDSPKELYEDILIWFTKLFSDNPHLFFALASIPFLFFFLKSLKQITSDSKFQNTLFCLIILLLFVLPRDIITVQNPRFATGLWLAVFATIKFYGNGKNHLWYYLLILITPFFHSGFWFYVIVFTAGFFVLRFERLSIILVYISIPFSYLSFELFGRIDLHALPIPPVLANWAERYMSEEAFGVFVLNEGASGFFWVTQIFTVIRTTAYAIIPIVLWRYRNEINQRLDLKNLFSFYLFYFAVVNFVQFIPVMGTRFYWITKILSIFLWFKVVYPRYNMFLIFILFSWSWHIFHRYFFRGAVYSVVPLDIFYSPLPVLITNFWEATTVCPLC